MRVSKLLFALFAVSLVTSASAFADQLLHLEVTNFQTVPYGYRMVWVNGPGSFLSAPVVFVRFNRHVVKIKDNLYRIDLEYPEVPTEVAQDFRFPLLGKSISCRLKDNVQNENIKVGKIENFESDMKDFRGGPDPLNYYTKSDGKHVCSVTVGTASDLSIEQQQILAAAVTTGMPNLAISEASIVHKSYSDIAQPYIDFLSSPDVSFHTDDEFWFLVAAAIHKDPSLSTEFIKASLDYMESWVSQFTLYVVSKGKPEYLDYVRKSFSMTNTEIRDSYDISNFTDERIYEL